jgi:hypothetical protein
MDVLFQGLEVPALGSPRDTVFRSYLSHKAKIEAKKIQLDLMIAVSNPSFSDAAKQRTWSEEAKSIFEDYISLLLGYQTKPRNVEEKEMLQFYTDVVKNSVPIVTKDSSGKLSAKIKFRDDPKSKGLKDSRKIGARDKFGNQ